MTQPKSNYLSRALFLLSIFSLLLLILTACQPALPSQSAAIVLPTQAVAVATVAAVENPQQENQEVVPPTWTPDGANPQGHLFIDPNATAAPRTHPHRHPSRSHPHQYAHPASAYRDATPVVSPTRFKLPEIPPTDELGPSKLGIHVIQNNDPAIMEFVREAQPAIVKGVGDLGFLQEVKEVSPRTITIGRVDDFRAQNYVGTPEEAAQAYVDKHLETFLLNPGVDYWEGWNEPDPNIDRMLWYNRFEQERTRQMARHGLKVAIGGFATGVPELEEFYLFLPAIDTAMQHGGILSLHEYGAPDMTYLYGSPLPGQQAYADRGALNFRYRWFYREILEPANMVIPLAITEAGIDGIIGNRPGPSGKGWKDFQGYWVDQGWGETGRQAFINQLAWYDAGVRQDGYVIGFTVFSAGANGISQWESYDINPILPELAGYVVGQR